MTPREQAFRDVVVDGGAIGAIALDRVTRTVLESYGQPLPNLAVLEVLFAGPPADGLLTRACGGPPVNSARALFVTGREQALFCALLRTGEVVVVATPPAMSVALGWTLVRALTAALEAS